MIPCINIITVKEGFLDETPFTLVGLMELQLKVLNLKMKLCVNVVHCEKNIFNPIL